ncbi:MAG: hypothetical protein PHI06_04345, partial [Desulfobulbaceae bacterium]|nr:hypothetical protein [Desulfobulbaceae bacterium]
MKKDKIKGIHGLAEFFCADLQPHPKTTQPLPVCIGAFPEAKILCSDQPFRFIPPITQPNLCPLSDGWWMALP